MDALARHREALTIRLPWCVISGTICTSCAAVIEQRDRRGIDRRAVQRGRRDTLGTGASGWTR